MNDLADYVHFWQNDSDRWIHDGADLPPSFHQRSSSKSLLMTMPSCPHNFRIYRNVLRQLYIAEFPISAYIQKKKHALAQKLSYAAITGEKGPSAALAIQLHGQRTANRACLPRQDRAKAIQRGTPPNPARVGTTDVRAGVGQGRRIDRKPGAS